MDDATTPSTSGPDGTVGKPTTAGKPAKAPKAAKPAKVKPRGPSRFAMLVFGLILGLVGGFMLPSLFPASAPTCEEPQRVIWERTVDGSVSQTIETDAATADACNVEVVFKDQ